METFLKADIFFFISSISTLVFTVIFLIAGIYFIKILINFHKISSIFRNAAENTEADLKELGEHIRESRLFTFFFGKKKAKEPKGTHKKTI